MELFTAQQIQSLNELELLVYRYINEHPNTVPFMRIRELAAEAHVSTTTVLHFCKKMGCDGYAQFKWKLKEQAGTSQDPSLPDTLNELQNFLWRVGTPEYDAALDEAAGLIARAERVFLVGIGTHAKDVYEALAQLLDLDENAADAPQTKQGIGSRIIATMSAVFAPFVYILAAAGLVQGALIIITHFAPAFAETGTYSVLSFISFFNTKYYVYAGLPGLLTTVNAMSDANPSSFTGMMIGVAATIIVTIILVQIVGCDEKEPKNN